MSKSIEDIARFVLERDISAVDFDAPPLKGSTELFEIRPTLVQEGPKQYLPVYGIYNIETGIRESEIRQYVAAKDWCKTLTAIAKGGEMPGLEIHSTETNKDPSEQA